jgi:gliding motility-associated-like protein
LAKTSFLQRKYFLQIKNVTLYLTAQGCGVDVDSIEITILPSPQIAITGNQYVCQNHEVNLYIDWQDTVPNSASVAWYNGIEAISNDDSISFNAAIDGLITVEAHVYIPIYECSYIATYTVIVQRSYEVIGLTDTLKLQQCETVVLNANVFPVPDENTIIYWSPSIGLSDSTSLTPTLTAPNGDMVYTLHVYGNEGCNSEHSIYVDVASIDSLLVFPNAFSPNNDGHNDTFYPILSKDQTVNMDFHIEIYSRWGEKIFESNDITEYWDGSYRNEKSELGVYVYQMTLSSPHGCSTYEKGNITLIR